MKIRRGKKEGKKEEIDVKEEANLEVKKRRKDEEENTRQKAR